MDKGSGLLTYNSKTHLKAQPRLRLLIEWESPYRVFLRNLADVFLFRSVPEIPVTARRGRFWSDVFVDSGLPWWGLLESILLHTLAMTAMWSLSEVWTTQERLTPRRNFQSYVSYYTPPASFPALGGSPSRVRSRPRRRNDIARRSGTGLAGHRGRSASNPSRRKRVESERRDVAADIPASSAIADSDARRLHLTAPARVAPGSIVLPPPPAVSQATSRGLGLPGTGVVAPPPQVGAVSSRNGVAGSIAAIVGPPPKVETSMRNVGDIAIGRSKVVEPSPQLPMSARTLSGTERANLGNASVSVVPPPPSVQHFGGVAGGRVGSFSRSGAQVVPPPPSVQSAGNSPGRGHVNSWSGAGAQVIPPPPSVQGAGNSPRSGRPNSWSGAGMQVIPPPPSVQSAGNSPGRGRVNSLSGAGAQVVPPSPSVQSAGNSPGSGRVNSLSGAGAQVVPPSPSVQGAGNSPGSGRMNSLAGVGAQVVPPPPSIPGAENSTGNGRLSSLSSGGPQGEGPSTQERGTSPSGAPGATDIHETVPPQPVKENGLGPGTEELSVRLIGPALSLPSSSYFANYEVFIAERRLKKDQLQFIKLVYESLPYQRRLSEYALNSTRVFRLRAKRDQSCDESLLQMTWPEGDPHPGSQYSADSPGLSASDRNNMLPCYRTTADDYRKAISRGR